MLRNDPDAGRRPVLRDKGGNLTRLKRARFAMGLGSNRWRLRLPECGSGCATGRSFWDHTLSVFLNRREVHQEQVGENHDPWIGVRAPWRQSARLRDFRITGRPEVPAAVLMSGAPELTGWMPYFEQSFGTEGAARSWADDPDSSGQTVGEHDVRLAGSFRESLLCYQRPGIWGREVCPASPTMAPQSSSRSPDRGS